MAPNKSKGKAKKTDDTSTVKAPKNVYCKNCKNFHNRPVGKSCTRPASQDPLATSDDHGSDVTYNSVPHVPQDPMEMLLQKLNNIEQQQKLMLERIEWKTKTHNSPPLVHLLRELQSPK